jgi:drug/metabolite transporter superfamily protein YnfA
LELETMFKRKAELPARVALEVAILSALRAFGAFSSVLLLNDGAAWVLAVPGFINPAALPLFVWIVAVMPFAQFGLCRLRRLHG